MALPYFTDRARESSSSTGTGAFTLGGAFTGYQTFADGGAEGQTVDYAIEAVDADGNPTGQWETGKGAYSAGVLTRTTPEAGSEALPVDFAAGSKNVFITVTAATFDMLLANIATGANGLALSGMGASDASGDGGAAIGFDATASGDGGVAVGGQAAAIGVYSVSVGYASNCSEDEAVALGHGSLGDVANAVSVGSTGSERRIVHVADGINPTDAATVGQIPAGPFGDFSGPASSTDNAIVRFDGAGGKTGQDSGVTVSDVSGSSVAVASTEGNALAVTSTAPAQTTTAQAGTAATFRASDAIAGSSVAGAAAGGSATVQAGDAKRLTSGNANGGALNWVTGAGIGSGTGGKLIAQINGGAGTSGFTMDLSGTQTILLRCSNGSSACGWTAHNYLTDGNGAWMHQLFGVRVANSNFYGWSSSSSATASSDTTLGRAGANSIVHAGSSATAGVATSRTEINKLVSSIADATATAVFTVTVPNAAHSANVEVTLNGSLGAGGAIGANEATGSIKYNVSIARTAGVNAVAAISTAYGSTTSSVAGAATITVTGDLSAISGAVGATNTFTIRVTITKGSGSSANHTCTAHAVLLNANATGITIA